MRRRVLTEITEKNRLLEEMGDLKKRHRKELAMEVKKFDGLEILYRKVALEKGVQLDLNLGGKIAVAEEEIANLKRAVEAMEGRLLKER
jgi:hypothetical protein